MNRPTPKCKCTRVQDSGENIRKSVTYLHSRIVLWAQSVVEAKNFNVFRTDKWAVRTKFLVVKSRLNVYLCSREIPITQVWRFLLRLPYSGRLLLGCRRKGVNFDTCVNLQEDSSILFFTKQTVTDIWLSNIQLSLKLGVMAHNQNPRSLKAKAEESRESKAGLN